MIEFFEFLNSCSFGRALLYLLSIGAMTLILSTLILGIVDRIVPQKNKPVEEEKDILDDKEIQENK